MSSESVFHSAEDDYDSSDSGSFSEASDFVPADIPSRREETAPIAPYTTYRLYGLDVEFPRDRTPFTSQKSTMTAVFPIWLFVIGLDREVVNMQPERDHRITYWHWKNACSSLCVSFVDQIFNDR